MPNEEILIKLSYLEQQSEEIRKNIESVEEQVKELDALKMSLEKIEKNKKGEMLANLGKGIFLETKINDDKVYVNVGGKILVRKSFTEAVETIDRQILELEEVKHQLGHNIEEINMSLSELVEEAREKKE